MSPRGLSAVAVIGAVVSIGCAVLAWQSPRIMMRLLAGDASVMPVVEHATVIVLIIAILVVLGLALRFRAVKGYRATKAWLWLWVAAALYFAGEEASWGQWVFDWDTPARWAATNQQGETNIHNISPWFNHKPQAVAEIFIAVAGWMLPIWRLTRHSHEARERCHWSEWVIAPPALIPAAMFHTATKICIWLPGSQRFTFGSPELQEFAIALFMALYMSALAFRIAALAVDSEAAHTGTGGQDHVGVGRSTPG